MSIINPVANQRNVWIADGFRVGGALSNQFIRTNVTPVPNNGEVAVYQDGSLAFTPGGGVGSTAIALRFDGPTDINTSNETAPTDGQLLTKRAGGGITGITPDTLETTAKRLKTATGYVQIDGAAQPPGNNYYLTTDTSTTASWKLVPSTTSYANGSFVQSGSGGNPLENTVNTGSANSGRITLSGVLPGMHALRFTVQNTAVQASSLFALSAINGSTLHGGSVDAGAFVTVSVDQTSIVPGTSFDLLVSNLDASPTVNPPIIHFVMFPSSAFSNGSVTQTSGDLTAGVTLNLNSGRITLGDVVGGMDAIRFTLTNSVISASSIVLVSAINGNCLVPDPPNPDVDTGAFLIVSADSITTGSCDILVSNVNSADTVNIPVIHFAVIN